MKIRDGGGGDGEGGWFSGRVSRRIGDGTNTLFWHNRWLGDVPLCRRFSRLFDLAVEKSITVASMFTHGWEEGATRGDGEEGCGCVRRICWRSVGVYLTIYFCSIVFLTGGSGNLT